MASAGREEAGKPVVSAYCHTVRDGAQSIKTAKTKVRLRFQQSNLTVGQQQQNRVHYWKDIGLFPFVP